MLKCVNTISVSRKSGSARVRTSIAMFWSPDPDAKGYAAGSQALCRVQSVQLVLLYLAGGVEGQLVDEGH
jgi:hypothetical protein